MEQERKWGNRGSGTGGKVAGRRIESRWRTGGRRGNREAGASGRRICPHQLSYPQEWWPMCLGKAIA